AGNASGGTESASAGAANGGGAQQPGGNGGRRGYGGPGGYNRGGARGGGPGGPGGGGQGGPGGFAGRQGGFQQVQVNGNGGEPEAENPAALGAEGGDQNIDQGPLGQASSSDAFLMNGTVGRGLDTSNTLQFGGPGVQIGPDNGGLPGGTQV